MHYQDLIEYGKKVFNFHPDSTFMNISDILREGYKSAGSYTCYDRAASLLAEELARYVDESVIK